MNGAIRRRSHKRKKGLSAMEREELHPIFEISETVALLEQANEANAQAIKAVAENTSRQLGELASNTDRQLREIAIAGEKRGAEFQSEMKALATEFAHSRQTNWPLIISFIGLIALFIGGAYQIVNLSTQVTMSPVVSQAKVSETDRNEIHSELASVKSETNKVDIEQKIVETKLKEIETQFKASDEARNVQFAEQQRMNSILLQLSQGAGRDANHPITYPAGPYYHPSISDHEH